ncbi:hypothetical protein BJV74DRAFT_274589 [Russula compacta]|nr:hypothetical protein BJV74DRAFT_274589 [Russula compacta]
MRPKARKESDRLIWTNRSRRFHHAIDNCCPVSVCCADSVSPDLMVVPLSPDPQNMGQCNGEPGSRIACAAAENPRRWRTSDAHLLVALGRLHEARARIDELELAVARAATQSERAREKLTYVPAADVDDDEVDVDVDAHARFEQELQLGALERDEANELVKNVCALLKGVVHQHQATPSTTTATATTVTTACAEA